LADGSGRILTIQLLGGFRISAGGTAAVGIDQARVQRMLAYLLLHRRAPRSRQQIAFTLWPDTSDAQALRNLRTLLTRLRQPLPEAERFLDIGAHAVRWRPDSSFNLDVADFEAAYEQAVSAERRGQPADAIVALERAVSLYTGDLLPGWYDEWLAPERERLRQAYLDALGRLAALLEQRRSYRQALSYAQRLVRADPLHEAVYRRLMDLHLALGDRASALRVYHTCATILRHELGVDPSPVTQAVYQRVLIVDASPARQELTPAAGATFVGRHAQWEALRSAWRQAATGQAQVMLISGEAGIGKTRLAEELLAWVQRQGIASAVARCYASAGSAMAFGPVVEWLRSAALHSRVHGLEGIWRSEAARLLPELLAERPDLPPPGPMTEAWQRQRFFQALNRAVLDQTVTGDPPTIDSATRPLLLLLDDVQWCDRETLDWLSFLLQANASVPLLVLGTVRAEEVEQGHPLAAFRLALAGRGHLHDLHLTPLSAAETAALASDLLGSELAPAQAEQLFHDTEGNPLFVVEMVRAGIGSREASGQGNQSGEGEEQTEGDPGFLSPQSTLPPKVRAVIQRRLSMLSPATQELTRTAAVIGREFTFDLLCHASGQDEAGVVHSLDELWRRQLVREQGDDAYDFSHDKIRVVAYAGISPIHRRSAHLSVAAAIETLNAGDLNPVSGQIATHYELAGRLPQAIAFYRRAAEAAQRIYANAEAIQLYNHLLSGEFRELLSPTESCELTLALGEVWRVTGQWTQAEAANREAMALAETLGDVALQARAQRALADVMRLQGHYEEALAWLAKAEHGFEATADWRGVVSALWTMGETYWFKGDNGQALAALERQLRLAGEIGDQRGICEALNTMGMVYWSQGDWQKSVDCCQRSIAIAEPLGYQFVITHAAITLGNVHSSQQQAGEALQWYLRAGVLARQIDDRQRLSWAIGNSANLLNMHGDYRGALAGYEQTLRVSLEIGDRWAAWLTVSNIGAVADRLQAAEPAEVLYRRAVGIGKRLGSPTYQTNMLVALAGLLLEQGRPAEASPIYREALETMARVEGEQIGGQDIRFSAQVLDVRLRHALGELDRTDAAAELRALLDQRSAPDQQAELHYELWRLDPEDEQARCKAAELYGSLHAETGLLDRRRRYQELTGETLPDPPPLPDVSELIPAAEIDLDGLIARLEPLLAQFEASFA
jgi:DNA-binding SARP family transcriptional activator